MLALPRLNTGRTHTAAPASVQRMLQAAPQCDGVAELYEAAVGDMCVPQLRNGVQPEDMGLWKMMLQLPSDNKGKEIWWFAMARCLPSATRLRLPPDQRACVLCDSGAAECTWHWFFDCPAASEVWRRANQVLLCCVVTSLCTSAAVITPVCLGRVNSPTSNMRDSCTHF